MKKYSIYKNYRLTILLLLVAFCGCKDFIEVEKPNSQLTTPAVFDDATTATAAMTDIYAQIREQGLITGKINGLSSLLGAYADELISFENGIYTTAPFYSNSLSSSMTYITNNWNRTYSQLYAVNAVLEGTENSQLLSEDAKKQIKGEALFLRAFLNFHLVNLYGDVPYVSTTDYTQNRVAARMDSKLLNQKIIADLENAIGLLKPAYIQAGRIRANKHAAQAFLARVFLYEGNYLKAAEMASAVLRETALYSVVNSPELVFLKDSPSTIWQLSAGANGANTYQGSVFIFQAGPPTRVSLTEELVAQFEVGDLRKASWIKSVKNGNNTWYYPFKYKQNAATATTLENSIVLRLEEQYLIRAEARAQLGDLVGAKEDLNVVRNRAGLAAAQAVSQNELLRAIKQERRMELFTEFGHRFFDLKRWGQLDEVLGAKAGWNSTDSLWPLPLAEMNANPLLAPQNPGY